MHKSIHPTLRVTRFALAIAVVLVMWTGLAIAEPLPELDCVIEPSEVVDVGSATAGVLEKVTFDRGDSVAKNAVIARLESGTEQAAAELARVRSALETGIELRRTSADFFARNQERSNSLTQQDAISRQQLDQLDTETRVAKLQVRQEMDNKRLAELEFRRAQQALRRRSIKSPIEGVVVERFKSVGEYVEDTPVMRIAQLDPLHVETIVPVDYLGKIKPGMQAKVTPSVPGHAPQYAVVSRIDRVADAASGTFGVRLTLDNPEGDIATGVRCALTFDESRSPALAKTAKPIEPLAASDTKTAARTVPTPDSAAAARTEPAQCFEAGPVASRASAEKFIARLAGAGAQAMVREVAGEHAGQFFVLTKKTKNRASAEKLLASLTSANVTDKLLLLRGHYARHISLGLYRDRKMAQRRVRELTAQGFDVRVAPRGLPTWWLEVTSPEKLDATALRELLAPTAPATVEAVPCATLQANVK